jgi:hypothetical protein
MGEVALDGDRAVFLDADAMTSFADDPRRLAKTLRNRPERAAIMAKRERALAGAPRPDRGGFARPAAVRPSRIAAEWCILRSGQERLFSWCAKKLA